MPEIALKGCTPEPLMNYLKALGVLRLVSEQKDKNAKGCWRNGVFWLKSELDEEGLVRFFLEEYRPTPIVAPWNGGSGFYIKWDDKKKGFKRRESTTAIERIAGSTSDRLQSYREAIKSIKNALSRMATELNLAVALAGKTKKEKKDFLDRVLVFESEGRTLSFEKVDKDDFIAKLRSAVLTDDSLCWLDTALVLTSDRKKNRHESPMLGSGGNVGNSDFSTMFVQMILVLMDGGVTSDEARLFLVSALLGTPIPILHNLAIGQFDPGKAGGANQTHGFEGGSEANPWDYVLMCEGALLIAGSITRRTETSSAGASFPFTVRSTGVGYGSAGRENSRGETWLPLWKQPARLVEIKAFFSEGRAEIRGKPAYNGLDFARAIAMLGVDRGISNFVRYGYQERFGQSFLAVPLGHFDVIARPEVDLIREVDRWLGRFRSAASDSKTRKAPPRFKSALRRIESAIFDFCQFGGTTRFGEILCALGQAERELALMGGKVGHDNKVEPLSRLSPEWLEAANYGSVEFELALALSSVWDPERKVGPLRSNLESITWFKHPDWKGYTAWATRQKSVVWTSTDLIANLVEVLERRMLDSSRSNCETVPLAGRHKVSLNAISAFIAGEVDDARIEELLWGMILIDHTKSCQGLQHTESEAPPIPRAYALLKLLFLPDEIETKTGKVLIKPEARILSLMRAGRADEACTIAARRLRISKVIPMPHGRIAPRDGEWGEATECVDPRRLAAALLFPINKDSVEYLKHQVIRPERDIAWTTR